MKRTIGGTSIYKADYEELLMDPSSQILLDKTFVKKLMSAEIATMLDRKILNELISSQN